MHRRTIFTFGAIVLAIVIVAVLLLMRGGISERVYRGTGEAVADKLPPALHEKYAEELRYTLDKFWSCYEDEIVSRNDLNDVMDRMRRLRGKDVIEDEDIFDFIGFVSRIYTDGLHRRHKRTLQQE